MKFTPHTSEDVRQMLEVCGCKDIQDLFKGIPENLRTKGLNLPLGLSEQDVASGFKKLAAENKICADNFLGVGAYRHYVPAAVSSLVSRTEFVTPYTPYQPEISQGTLQVMFEYQSLICRLTGMDVSNASHYDGATAAADAALMARRVTKKNKIIIPENLHPHYAQVVKTVSRDVQIVSCTDGLVDLEKLRDAIKDDAAALFLSFPNVWGQVQDMSAFADFAHEKGALVIAVVPEPLSLAMFVPPGNWGADIVVGEGMSFGMNVTFGGPTLGIFACKEKYLRNMPGRICGQTTDSNGRRAFVLTLATREQHIRREKATSNICSNQALCATTAAIYLGMLGSNGLKDLAKLNASKAAYARRELLKIKGITDASKGNVFNEFTVKLSKPAAKVAEYCRARNLVPGFDAGRFYKDAEDKLIVCCTEMNSKDSIDRLAKLVGEALS